MKKGRITKAEDRFIRDNLSLLTAEAIAIELDRNVDSVANYIKRKFHVGVTKAETAAFSLEDRPFWVEIKQQFTNSELDLFKYHWGRIVSQFNDDVLPTEEMQIVDVIKIEMLMNRCLKTNKDNIEAITRAEVELEGLLGSHEPEHLERALNLERQLGALRAGQESINRDYRDLQTKKSSMLKEMKGTREQRIKKLEDAKQSFSVWVGQLNDSPDKIDQYGREMEMMRLAAEKERGRLSGYHKYTDGMVDQPFLNHETVLE